MDSSWSCVGGNLLDVLLEMERERGKKEKVASWITVCQMHAEQLIIRSSLKGLWTFQLYWEIQLQLNVGNNTSSEAASPVTRSDRIHRVDSQTHESQVWALPRSPCESRLCWRVPLFFPAQKQRVLAKKDLSGGVNSVKRLRKSARQFWARSASAEI